jgi:hypothetical protein
MVPAAPLLAATCAAACRRCRGSARRRGRAAPRGSGPAGAASRSAPRAPGRQPGDGGGHLADQRVARVGPLRVGGDDQPVGQPTGRSLRLCTARSRSRRARPRSSSSVKRPLPPTAARSPGRRSPRGHHRHQLDGEAGVGARGRAPPGRSGPAPGRCAGCRGAAAGHRGEPLIGSSSSSWKSSRASSRRSRSAPASRRRGRAGGTRGGGGSCAPARGSAGRGRRGSRRGSARGRPARAGADASARFCSSGDQRLGVEARYQEVKRASSCGDDLLDPRHLLAPLRLRLRWISTSSESIVEEDVGQAPTVRLDVARHAEVDGQQRPRRRAQRLLDLGALEHRLVGAGGGHHHVRRGERGVALLERQQFRRGELRPQASAAGLRFATAPGRAPRSSSVARAPRVAVSPRRAPARRISARSLKMFAPARRRRSRATPRRRRSPSRCAPGAPVRRRRAPAGEDGPLRPTASASSRLRTWPRISGSPSTIDSSPAATASRWRAAGVAAHVEAPVALDLRRAPRKAEVHAAR